MEIIVPDVKRDILNKERPAAQETGSEDKTGIDGVGKRECEVDKLVVVVATREVGDVMIAKGGKVWVLDGVKIMEDGVTMVLDEVVRLLGEFMLAVLGELRVFDGAKRVGEVVMVLNEVMMVFGVEVGLPVEVMPETGGIVGVLDVVMMVLSVVLVLDGVVMVHVGVTSEVVGFICEEGMLEPEDELPMDVAEED